MDINTDDQLRLRALKEYNILDTEEEPAYDDLTFVASTICRTPMALVCLFDEDRVWFKSHRGTSLKQCFLPAARKACKGANKTKIISDAQKDPGFQEMELVKGPPYIRFYAGAPLVTPTGAIIGTLCVVDLEPRSLTSEQVQALEALARQVMILIELKKSQNVSPANPAKLAHQIKLASLGEMANSIAHEINNPLTIINGNVGLLRRVLAVKNSSLSAKVSQYLGSIERNVHRVDKIIRDLNVFTKSGAGEPLEKIDLLNSIINAKSLMWDTLRKHGISVREALPSKSAWVECRPVQVEQMIINLLSNSIDATRELDEKWIEIAIQEEGDHWRIKVIDSGNGIPAELHDKIMEPFFSTKGSYQGAGLGLSICKAMAEDHGGSLELDKNKKNTCFILSLPKKNPNGGGH